MTKDELKEKLSELGIETDNCFPKSTFPHNKIISVGLYEREMREDFYFYSKYDNKIYRLPKAVDIKSYEIDKSSDKRMVPLTDCEVMWEDKPFVEKLDAAYNTMTLRQYACIQMRIPDTGLDWLDNLIKEGNKGRAISLDQEILKSLYGTG